MDQYVKQEINQIEVRKPHVFILGAGASYAALPNGDKSGKKLPLMNNFIETLGLNSLIKSIPAEFPSSNFEDIYSVIHSDAQLDCVRETLEKTVYDYFSSMQLPDYPTIYDNLVLSLRDKDFIATFNWDPFLVQAIRRNGKHFAMPRPLFLHGNVEVGYCQDGHMMGTNGELCHTCETPLTPTKILYPITEKDYGNDEFISRQWVTLKDVLKSAFWVTIFGYGAPTSDKKAIDLLKDAWGSPDQRPMEEFEIIDIRDEDDLIQSWKPFIHTHHYRTETNFYESWTANHPRRTGEAYKNQYLDAQFIGKNPVPKDLNFDELWKWYEPLKMRENENT